MLKIFLLISTYRYNSYNHFWNNIGSDSLSIKSQLVNSMEMTKVDILKIENSYLDSALSAKNIGFDIVKFHGTHFHLIYKKTTTVKK